MRIVGRDIGTRGVCLHVILLDDDVEVGQVYAAHTEHRPNGVVDLETLAGRSMITSFVLATIDVRADHRGRGLGILILAATIDLTSAWDGFLSSDAAFGSSITNAARRLWASRRLAERCHVIGFLAAAEVVHSERTLEIEVDLG